MRGGQRRLLSAGPRPRVSARCGEASARAAERHRQRKPPLLSPPSRPLSSNRCSRKSSSRRSPRRPTARPVCWLAAPCAPIGSARCLQHAIALVASAICNVGSGRAWIKHLIARHPPGDREDPRASTYESTRPDRPPRVPRTRGWVATWSARNTLCVSHAMNCAV